MPDLSLIGLEGCWDDDDVLNWGSAAIHDVASDKVINGFDGRATRESLAEVLAEQSVTLLPSPFTLPADITVMGLTVVIFRGHYSDLFAPSQVYTGIPHLAITLGHVGWILFQPRGAIDDYASIVVPGINAKVEVLLAVCEKEQAGPLICAALTLDFTNTRALALRTVSSVHPDRADELARCRLGERHTTAYEIELERARAIYGH